MGTNKRARGANAAKNGPKAKKPREQARGKKQCPNCPLSHFSAKRSCPCGFNFKTQMMPDNTVYERPLGTAARDRAGKARAAGSTRESHRLKLRRTPGLGTCPCNRRPS